jgi:hypothetical protein
VIFPRECLQRVELGVPGLAKSAHGLLLRLKATHRSERVAHLLVAGCGGGAVEDFRRDRPHFDEEVEAVEERTGQSTAVRLKSSGRTSARQLGVGEVAAGARVGGRDEEDVGGEDGRVSRPTDADHPLLQWLSKRLQCGTRELRELIQKQDSTVGA